MSRTIAAILLVAVLAIGGGLIATTAYQAGLNTAVTTAVADGATVVTPLPGAGYGYGYGYGWHPGGFGFGLGFFGLLGTLLFVFLLIGLIRALLFRGGRGRHGGWGPGGGGWGPGWGPSSAGPGGPGEPGSRGPGGGRFWEARLGDSFQEWHRQAHVPESSTEPPTSNTGSKPA